MIELELLAAPGRYHGMGVKKGDLSLSDRHLVALVSDTVESDDRLSLVLPGGIS